MRRPVGRIAHRDCHGFVAPNAGTRSRCSVSSQPGAWNGPAHERACSAQYSAPAKIEVMLDRDGERRIGSDDAVRGAKFMRRFVEADHDESKTRRAQSFGKVTAHSRAREVRSGKRTKQGRCIDPGHETHSPPQSGPAAALAFAARRASRAACADGPVAVEWGAAEPLPPSIGLLCSRWSARFTASRTMRRKRPYIPISLDTPPMSLPTW